MGERARLATRHAAAAAAEEALDEQDWVESAVLTEGDQDDDRDWSEADLPNRPAFHFNVGSEDLLLSADGQTGLITGAGAELLAEFGLQPDALSSDRAILEPGRCRLVSRRPN